VLSIVFENVNMYVSENGSQLTPPKVRAYPSCHWFLWGMFVLQTSTTKFSYFTHFSAPGIQKYYR
jgi:hypothetical protein